MENGYSWMIKYMNWLKRAHINVVLNYVGSCRQNQYYEQKDYSIDYKSKCFEIMKP